MHKAGDHFDYQDVGLVAEVSDDLELAPKSLDVGGQGIYLAALQLTLLDPGDAPGSCRITF